VSDIPGGFKDTNRADDAEALIGYLDSVGEQLAPLKRRISEALNLLAGEHVIDVGSGTGDDVREMARAMGPAGRVVGLDSGADLIDEARRRTRDCPTGDYPTVEFHLGDAHELAFEDDAFDKARAERVLMHVEKPTEVVGEIARVLRAGGVAVLAEPDWDTLIVDSDDLGTARRAARLVADCARHPDIGRRLSRLATTQGLKVFLSEAISIVMRDCKTTNDITQIQGIVKRSHDQAVQTWWNELTERSAHERFLGVLSFVVIAARKPQTG
jgi:SAM-dependent methyltransferase